MVEIPDPGKVKSWGAIATSIVAGILAIGLFVYDSRAQDAANAAAVVVVDGRVDQLVLTVDGISEILLNQEAARKDAASVAKAKRGVMREMCKTDAIRSQKPIECALADVGS